MSPAKLIARHSLANLIRDRSVLMLVGFFAAMVLVTAWLGWSASATVNAIYGDAVQYLTAAGQPVPPNPIGETAPLAVLRNLGIYISLIGAFGAIVIGQLLIETDRKAGTLPLIGARPFDRRDIALGKMRALVIATGAMMAVAGVISVATLFTVPALVVGAGDLMHLALFLVAGWAYITVFGLGVDRTWWSCGAFFVCDGQPTIENCGPCDGYSVSPFGRPTHPSALSHAGIGNVID